MSRRGASSAAEAIGRRAVGEPDQRFDRPIQLLVALRFMRGRLESQLVFEEAVPEIAELPVVHPLEFVEIPVVLRVFADGAKHAREHLLVHRLDDHIEAGVLVVDIEPRVNGARRGNAQPRIERHRDGLVNAGRVLRHVVEHERLQAEKSLRRGVAVEVDAQPGFVRAARAAAARADADVTNGLAIQRQIGRVVGVGLEFGPQLRPVGRMQEQIHTLEVLAGKQRIGGLGLRGACRE